MGGKPSPSAEMGTPADRPLFLAHILYIWQSTEVRLEETSALSHSNLDCGAALRQFITLSPFGAKQSRRVVGFNIAETRFLSR